MPTSPHTPAPASGTSDRTAPVLSVKDLEVAYRTGRDQSVRALRGVSFDLHPETSLALVGESGCGKTTLGLALLRLLPTLGEITGGSITFTGDDGRAREVTDMTPAQLRRWRWSEAAMVFQGAQNAFNPVLTVGAQMADTLRDHATGRLGRREIHERSAEALRSVRLEPRRVLGSYPHELSGGMKQRVAIAIALVLEPDVIFMDEPTTALDLLVQREVLDQIVRLREQYGFAIVFTTHDLALLLEISDTVAVMRHGRLVEYGPARETYVDPQHPYTRALLSSLADLGSLA